MLFSYLAFTASLAALATASPLKVASPVQARDVTTVTVSGTTATTYPQPAYDIAGFPIHSSCNATERNQLEKAFGDTIRLAQHAASYILQHGNSSDLFVKYFGTASVGEPVGWYEQIVHGNRGDGLLFRCDDIDGNCVLPGWGGHWRGSNNTQETVICELSFMTRQPLENLCSRGYTVAGSPLAWTWAGDLMHRLYHVPSVGNEIVEHFADSYAECLELAEEAPEEAVRNTHSLQYFALDVYAREVAVPGEGCTGKAPVSSSAAAAVVSSTSAASVSMASSSASSSTLVPSSSAATTSVAASRTSAAAVAASTVQSAAAECHTHSNGDVHCA